MQIIVDNQNKQQENLKIMQENIINNCKVRYNANNERNNK